MEVLHFTGFHPSNNRSTGNAPRLSRIRCSPAISKLMKANELKICQNIPVSVMRQKLVEYSVIEEDNLQHTNEDDDNSNEIAKLIWKKLRDGGDRGFYIFCNILKEQSDEQLRLLGLQLSNDAKKITALSDDDLLRNVPPLPQIHFIVRNDFVNQTANAIMKIHARGGRLLVYGPSGTGKTVAVSNCLQYVIRQKQQFLPHGVYWITIGKVDKQKLFEILSNLMIKLEMRPQTFPSLKQLNQAISNHLEALSDLSFTLFIFDEVEEPSYMDYLTFAKNSVVISTQSSQAVIEKFDYNIQSQESFTQQEALQIIASFQENAKTQSWVNDDIVKQVVGKYRSSPQAIALVGGAQLKSLDEWKEVQALPEAKRTTKQSENTFTLFTHIMNKLPERTRKLFTLLGACFRVKIPVAVITILWNLPADQVSVILQDLHRRSLLSYASENDCRPYCQINNLIMDYLQLPSNAQYVQSDYMKNLHLNLINQYQLHCDENWILKEDDGYFYRYFMNHLMAAEKDDIIQQILSNSEWINNQLKLLKQPSFLYANMEQIQDYLQRKDLDSTSKPLEFLKRFEKFLPKSDPDLLQLILDFAPSDSPLRQQAYKSARRLSKEGKGIYLKLSYSENRSPENFYDIQNLPEEEEPNLRNLVIERGNPYTLFEGKIYRYAESFDHKMKARGYGPFRGMNMYRFSWEIVSVEEGLQLLFILENGEKATHLEACSVQFLERSNTSFVTISEEKHQLHLWEIKDGMIHCIRSSTPTEFYINNFSFVPDTTNILVAIERYQRWNMYMPKDLINECYIEVWTLKNLQPISKITVPARMNSSYKPLTGKPDPSDHLISYVGPFDDSRYLISYGNISGLLTIENCRDKTEKDFANHWSDMFKIIDNGYTHLAISKDKKYIACMSYFGDILFYQVGPNEITYYSMIVCENGNSRISFVDDSYDIMIHFDNTRLYYAFPTTYKPISTQGQANAGRNYNLQVSKNKIVNNVLVIAEIIKTEDNFQLKVHRGDRQEEVSSHHFGSHYKSTFVSKDHSTVDLFLFEDLPSILLTEVYACENEDCLKDQDKRHYHCFYSLRRFDDLDHDFWVYEILVSDFKHQESQPPSVGGISPSFTIPTLALVPGMGKYGFIDNTKPNIRIESFYRQYDNQIMVIITESRRLIILFIDAASGATTAKHVEEINDIAPAIAYLANENFVLYHESNTKVCAEQERILKKYKMQGSNIQVVQCVKGKLFNEEERPVSTYCKMTISEDNKDIQLTDVLNVDDDDKIKEQFGLTDWKISKKEGYNRALGILIRKGNYAMVFREPSQGSHQQASFYAGNRKIEFNPTSTYLPHLWDKKYAVIAEGSGIEIYDNATLQLKLRYSPIRLCDEYVTSVQASPDGKTITCTQPHSCLNIMKAII
ncbi:uncharacterized protein TRIADDRAFT_61937 [Trichoplax adhaerens]|uniref:APAF-1 helical domain-containing protein n=1 Tax=Trichoplax adhaerens TaxID=10228 RepID=B3SCD5_TRIAD|nr:predicted protein [Trichoplax adhaerens]EDV19569.1 predicted protein [Trichoplax adhaerens]|eukprot:XP_002117902.1 predicted protein [Trichoplax adhaerens]